MRLVLKNVADKVVVLGKLRQVVVPSALDADKRSLARVDLLQGFALPDGNEPVAGAVNDVNGTGHFCDPFIGPEFIAQHEADG